VLKVISSPRMGRRVLWAAAALAFSLALGVGSAGGHPLAVSTITVEVIGKGTIKSDPGGIKCGNGYKDCYAAFTNGGTVTLDHVSSASGWSFDSWSGDCGPGDPCNLNTSGGVALEVTANFKKSSGTGTSTLSVSYTGGGNVSAPETAPTGSDVDCGSDPAGTTCSWTVPTGSTLTVFETAAGGNVFGGWAGDCTGTDNACTVEMSDDRSVNATWEDASAASSTLTVAISGNGAVKGGNVNCVGPSTCTATEPINDTITLSAVPASGYTFTGWTGACTGTGPTCTVTMNVDRTVTATFALAVQLTVSVSGNGNISGGTGAINCGNGGTVCSATFAQNATVSLIATVATGATFVGWSGACGGSSTTCTVSMSSARSVTATFTGGTPGGTGTTALLSVAVSGIGTVTGGGIRCGNGSNTCSASQTLNASVVLTETPGTGATFTGWGGACAGTSTTCTVVMATAKSVTANFSGGTPSTLLLSVAVTGHGNVKGDGISCGNGLATCSVSISPGTTVILTATPATGASFTGWGGACAGTKTTCSLTPTASTTVTAAFSGGGTTGGGTVAKGALTSRGRPIVTRTKTGFRVSLRFRTQVAGAARVRGFRAGRVVTGLSVRVPAGNATIGPFPVALRGLYTFELRLGSHVLRWRACLGLCGAAARAPAFVVTRQIPVVTRTGAVWSVTLRFRENAISDAHIAVRRGGKLLANHHFLGGARQIIVGPFLLGAGSYTLTLRAVDAYGRVRTLTWIVALAR
jgi:uncharacterized repeat protein (TIGR02543 family)